MSCATRQSTEPTTCASGGANADTSCLFRSLRTETCRLDQAHGGEEVLIVAGANMEAVMGPAVVDSDWYIELLRSGDNALLRDISTRLHARCVGCG